MIAEEIIISAVLSSLFRWSQWPESSKSSSGSRLDLVRLSANFGGKSTLETIETDKLLSR